MTERPIDLSSLPSYRQPRRSLFSARKMALMASVVAGLGVAIYGFSPSTAPVDLFTSPAHAQCPSHHETRHLLPTRETGKKSRAHRQVKPDR